MKKLLSCLFVAALLPLNVVSQTPAPSVPKSTSDGQFTLKASTEVVLVNVTVRDRNDNFVKNLKAQDFTILEDGKRQDIVSLDVENTDSVVSAESPKLELLGDLNSATRPTAPAPLSAAQE